MSERHAFRMRLDRGKRAEYQRRHDEIWPELVELLHAAGISDYSIWLDEETDCLFAILTRSDDHTMDTLPDHPVMRRWWAAMADLMETHPDKAPVAMPLMQVFHMD
jgi:L-rhamnose mutarotase